jgi:uncharacterized protein DUF3616
MAARLARSLAAATLPLVLGSCGGEPRPVVQAGDGVSGGAAPSARPDALHYDPAADLGPLGKPVVFRGMCDASGAVRLGNSLVAVGDDEDNVLRIYDVDRGGAPLTGVDVSPALRLRKRSAEADIEGGTRLGELAIWITSHGRNSKGKVKESRFRMFATSAPADGKGFAAVGEAYESLLDDIIAAPALAPFHLDVAAALSAKAPGGLNIEGLSAAATAEQGSSAAADRGVLVGFRSPVPDGLALLVPLRNPEDVLLRSARAELGPPIRLDLDGLGVRAMVPWRRGHLIAAGNPVDRGVSRLFVWDGEGTAPRAIDLDLRAINPEAFAAFPDRDAVLVLSDDGTVMVDGIECKDQPLERRTFRGIWIRP